MNTLNFHSAENGFTLMELMIVIAIISILSSVAIPAYQGYLHKAALTDVLQTLSPYRSAIEICHYDNQISECNSGSAFIPEQFNSRYISSINVEKGEIYATGKAQLEDLAITMTLEKNRPDNLPHWLITCHSSHLALQNQCIHILKAN